LTAGRARERARGPEDLGSILKRSVRDEAARRRRVDGRARSKWEEVAGPEIAARTTVVGFKQHVLRIEVDSSVLLAELAGVYKRELISSMAEGEDPVAVRTIDFVLAGASR